MDSTQIVKKPLVTEKSTYEMNEHNRYTFLVDRRASKDEIKSAIERLYDVKVETVSTQNRKGKSRRLRYGWVKEGVTKKATVRLREGQAIDLF